jgi:quinolinate synthase
MTSQNAGLTSRISALKEERHAVILAHNYQIPEVQDIADFVGDSLELSQKAAATEADVIVFCGVHFMAETTSILSPEKKILLPDMNAGCPMADMITAAGLREMKEQFPGSSIVSYVNTTAEVKAESDICCTSANAVRVVESLNGGDIIFVPDQYLGDYVRNQTGRSMHLWPGYCPTHVKIRTEDIIERRCEHPKAKVVVHPECRPDVIALADETLSTGGMIRYARRPDVAELIVGTEPGIIHRLEKENPGKKLIAVSEMATCPNMKLITLEKVCWALEALKPEVKVAEDIRVRARMAVDRMLEVS